MPQPEPPTITLSEEEFQKLPEYSTSIPTGTRIGKKWKANRGGVWWMCEYTDIGSPTEVGISWSRISTKPIKAEAKLEETKEPEYVSALRRELADLKRDYADAQADNDRLVRELDVALNGLCGAAPQARLCDIVSQVKDGRWTLSKAGSAHLANIRTGWLHNLTQVLCAIETEDGHVLIAHPDAPPKVEGMAMHWRPTTKLPEWIRKGRLC